MSTNTEFKALREKSGLSCQEAAEKLSVSLRTLYRWDNGETVPKKIIMEKLREISDAANNTPHLSGHDFTFIDLFAGIGGFRKSFDSIGGKCVFTSEWDKASRTTYMQNYECDHPVEGDIRDFTKDDESLAKIPKHDLLVGGFPCQPFSLAGVSKKNSLGRSHGFKDKTQGTLFFDVARILEFHKPSAFLLENVKNLVSHDKGNTFRVIRETLEDELEYKIHFKVIDAKPWVPQHRERIFIVGFKTDTGFSFDNINKPAGPPPSLSSILHGLNPAEDDEFPFFEDGKVSSKYTLSTNLWQYLKAYKEKHTAKGNGFGFSLFGPDDVARTLSARYHKDGSEILIRQVGGKRPRRLTPRECARIMGFDKPGESNFKIPVSDTQAYRQFGNSVVVPLATAIANAMKPCIIKSMMYDKNQLTLPFDELAKSA